MAREFEKAGRYGNVECMMSRQQYIEYLLNTPVNYTCSNLAEHLDGVSHDAVSDFLQRGRVTANRLWELVKPFLNDSAVIEPIQVFWAMRWSNLFRLQETQEEQS